MGREDCRAHDLRHSALTVAAEHGATLATLMQMAGHSTPAAAQRYQHATTEHARRVAAAMDASATALLQPTDGAGQGLDGVPQGSSVTSWARPLVGRSGYVPLDPSTAP